MTKKEMREKAQELRDNIRASDKKIFDKSISQNLFSWKCYQKARCIFCFVSFRSEVNTFNILETSIAEGKTIAVPQINLKTGEMKAKVIKDLKKDLCPGEYGILEPTAPCREVDYSKLNLIIAPGLAFTLTGARLGYGGGYYDRFIQKNSSIPVCTLAYHVQIIDYLPIKKHDIPVDYLITEKGLINTGRGKHEKRV